MNMQNTLDKTAISLSLLCGVHCLILPMIAVVAPTSISFALTDEAFHQWLVWGIIPVSTVALFMGCRKHERYRIFLFGAVGLAILGSAGFLGHDYLGEFGEKLLTIVGGTVIAFGHVSNYRLCRKEECECDAPSHNSDSGEWTLTE